MKILLVSLLLALAMSSVGYSANVTAFLTGESITGNTKQCIYDALGNTHVRTISAYAICPQTIQVSFP